MEVREVLSREGREAKNLLVYQFCDETTTSGGVIVNGDCCRKPPVAPPKSPTPKVCTSPTTATTTATATATRSSTVGGGNSNGGGGGGNGPRVRSASTGRDKKSELQARYWALLFGNLQRAVNEIYQTVECYENISSCQEAILVLENYVRDFKALSEWFKVAWDYESRPLQQRPQSLAWEVRKSNPTPTPRVRTKSLCSPSPTPSGKSSPSGKISPCCIDGRGSPRKMLRAYEQLPKNAMRVNVRELFAANSSSSNNSGKKTDGPQTTEQQLLCSKYSQTDLEDPHLTLADLREKARREAEEREAAEREQLQMQREEFPVAPIPTTTTTKLDADANTDVANPDEEEVAAAAAAEPPTVVVVVEEPQEPTAVQLTVAALDEMENALLIQQADKEPTPPSAVVKKLPPTLPSSNASGAGATNSPMKYSSVLNRPAATRQKSALAKPTTKTAGAVQPINGLRRNNSSNNNNNSNSNNNNSKTASSASSRSSRSSVIAQPPRPSSKTECYGPPNNVASRLSARSRTMLDMQGNKRSTTTTTTTAATTSSTKPMAKRAVSSLLSRSKQSTTAIPPAGSSREDVASSTSTLKASTEQLAGGGDVNDGWLTVKNRRRSSMYWANRFHQPTGYASLPTLALLNEQEEQAKQKQQQQKQQQQQQQQKQHQHQQQQQKQQQTAKTTAKFVKSTERPKTRPEIKNAKAKVNSFPPQQVNNSNNNSNSNSNSSNSNNSKKSNPISMPIKRQKSDLTGLKMTSLHKEYMRIEKNAQRKLQQQQKDNALVASSSSETVQEASERESEHNKIDIKIQTNCEFSKTIGELYESIARCKLPNGCVKDLSLSACDEDDEGDVDNDGDNDNDADGDGDERMLVKVQESLERQIRELESTEIDVDTETDETDYEVVLEELDDQPLDVVFVTVSEDENASLELRYQALLSEMSGNERAETLATLQAYVARHPGRAQELHQKLSSPSRRRSLQETLRKYQAKQARAQQKRELLQQEKAAKLQQLLARVEDVKTAKTKLIENKRLKMEGRLQRAAENREQFLRQIIEKAHDEEKKLKEINFIKNIEAQNKRLDLLESSKETEGRLQDLEQERQKRVEEKAAKEAAVERRRQALEKERQLKIEKMYETRLEKEQRIGKMQEQKERQRQALAREKARDRETRLAALQVQKQQTTEELQRKILQKQMESARRHEENMEHIRQRALELSIPTRSETREQEDGGGAGGASNDPNCSEDFHGTEDGELSSTLSEVGASGGKEHSRSYKKKMKKLKQRMSQNALEYLESMEELPVHVKRDSSVPKLLNLVIKGGGAHGLDRTLGNLLRVIPKAQTFDFQAFLCMNGLGILATHVISKAYEDNTEISLKSLTLAVQLYRNACSVCPQIARHALLGNSITVLFDAINKSFLLPEEKSPQHPVELSTELMLACTEALSSSYVKKNTHPKVPERLPDMINYAVLTGLIEMLARRCMKVRESVEHNQSTMLSLLTTLGFLSRFIDVCPPGPGDPTRLLSAAKSTELFGTVNMLSGGIVPIGECIPPRTTALAASTFNLYVCLAALDVHTFQEALSIESPLSLKLLDVITLILNYAVTQPTWAERGESFSMLIDMIATLAFFLINNRKHQDFLVSDQFMVIMKSLAKMSSKFYPVIYPLLVILCSNNASARQKISNDFDLGSLDEYSKSEAAKRNRLLQMINDKDKDKEKQKNNNFKG